MITEKNGNQRNGAKDNEAISKNYISNPLPHVVRFVESSDKGNKFLKMIKDLVYNQRKRSSNIRLPHG